MILFPAVDIKDGQCVRLRQGAADAVTVFSPDPEAMAWASRLEGAPAIVHAQDWQAALVPSYLHFLRPEAPYWHKTKTVLTIHNLAFQGRFASRLFWDSGLPKAAWNMHFRETVNVTLGLPFVRTSVGHGTAFDLVGTDRASTASLAAAIELARKLAG